MTRKYANLFDRLKAHTRLANPDDPGSCWIWTGSSRAGYPAIGLRRLINGKRKHKTMGAHRLMLEEYYNIEFPFDEAGHLCDNSLCINPTHLEVQTKALNLALRKGYMPKESKACWIPTIFPRDEAMERAIDDWWEHGGIVSRETDDIPF